MTVSMLTRRSTMFFLVLAMAGLFSTGCCRYAHNRVFDAMDIFELGAGVTAENPVSGMIPPALGVHAQVTEFLNLGAVHFTGYSAEMDGRGLFAGFESRTRIGCLPLQVVRIDQDYEFGWENYFKKVDTKWDRRMSSTEMRFKNKAAKELNYKSVNDWMRHGAPLFYRGWQYWGNTGVELAFCEPFLTHWGFDLRVLVDPSEISDFVLGWFFIDFKQDDMNRAEIEEHCDYGKPKKDTVVVAPASTSIEEEKK